MPTVGINPHTRKEHIMKTVEPPRKRVESFALDTWRYDLTTIRFRRRVDGMNRGVSRRYAVRSKNATEPLPNGHKGISANSAYRVGNLADFGQMIVVMLYIGADHTSAIFARR